jgi:WhiB family redox-sensing transcriptional regulator
MTSLDWQADALCTTTDPDAFFPEKSHSPRPAKTICGMCPVKAPCLEIGMGHDFGIFGGKTARERQQMRREVRAA